MSEHTKVRLNYAYDGKNVAAGGVRYCSLEAFTTQGEYTVIAKGVLSPDARRLAACWNACIGFETESLENIVMLGETMHSRFAALKAECDQAHRELDAARALLREVMAQGGSVDQKLDNRIDDYLDACDTLEGAPNEN